MDEGPLGLLFFRLRESFEASRIIEIIASWSCEAMIGSIIVEVMQLIRSRGEYLLRMGKKWGGHDVRVQFSDATCIS